MIWKTKLKKTKQLRQSRKKNKELNKMRTAKETFWTIGSGTISTS